MSFDVYLQAFHDGEPAGIAIEKIRSAFSPYAVEIDEDYWRIEFGGEVSSDLFLQPLAGDAKLIHILSVHRPCGDARLWNALWLLLAQPGTVFHFPGCAYPMTRDPGAGTALPPSLRDALGVPQCIGGAAAMSDALQSV
jgi:hypothetical protein